MIKEKYKSLLFILPAVVYIAGLAFVPSIYAVSGSFQTRLSSYTLINYTLIQQGGVVPAIYNTIAVTLLALFVQFVLGFIIAAILTKKFVGKRIFSVLFLLPFGVATVVAGFVFDKAIFTYSGGYANALLSSLGIYHILGISYLDFRTKYLVDLVTLVIADSWKNTPIVALILLAGMNSISPDIYAQAEIDGAGAVSRFFRITLPNLTGFIAIALIIRGVSEFNIFAIAKLMFHPQILTTMTYSLFQDGITDNEAEAAATILLAFIIVFAAVIIYFRGRSFKVQQGIIRKRDWYEKYHWFYTSGGFLSVTGRNSAQGKKMLSTQASDQDIIIGSDSVSVPDTVIFSKGSLLPTIKAIREACSYAYSFTDAWKNSDSGSVEFYWKKGPGGEKSTINAVHSNIDIAISEISGEPLPMVTPTGTSRKTAGQIIMLKPANGNTDQKMLAKKIASMLRIRAKEVHKILGNRSLDFGDVREVNTSIVLDRGGGAADAF